MKSNKKTQNELLCSRSPVARFVAAQYTIWTTQ